jgi:hypothetical protein
VTWPSPILKSARRQVLTQPILGTVCVLVCMVPLTSRATETVAKSPRANLDYHLDGRDLSSRIGELLGSQRH